MRKIFQYIMLAVVTIVMASCTSDIKEQLKSITDSQLAQFIEAYGSDERGGVIKLVDCAIVISLMLISMRVV